MADVVRHTRDSRDSGLYNYMSFVSERNKLPIVMDLSTSTSTLHNITETLPTIPLPLSTDGPPEGFTWEEAERTESVKSSTTAFNTGINERDTFAGVRRCVVCGGGSPASQDRCDIIMRSEPYVWKELKTEYNWIPEKAKDEPQHEPRNGLLMCANHHKSFDAYDFFIRYVPAIKKFVFINYSGFTAHESFHGKAIALDITHRHVPFPSLFIIHEMRVRGFHPFQPTEPPIPQEILFQDWIVNAALFDHKKGSFNRDRPPPKPRGSSQPQLPATSMRGESSGGRTLPLNANVIQEILTATRSMPSWKACEVEGTSWTGTAEENIQKYASIVGTDLKDS